MGKRGNRLLPALFKRDVGILSPPLLEVILMPEVELPAPCAPGPFEVEPDPSLVDVSLEFFDLAFAAGLSTFVVFLGWFIILL